MPCYSGPVVSVKPGPWDHSVGTGSPGLNSIVLRASGMQSEMFKLSNLGQVNIKYVPNYCSIPQHLQMTFLSTHPVGIMLDKINENNKEKYRIIRFTCDISLENGQCSIKTNHKTLPREILLARVRRMV